MQRVIREATSSMRRILSGSFRRKIMDPMTLFIVLLLIIILLVLLSR